uniref:Transcription factor Pcc1 n=1 Tax=Geoglobus ahangari TaxID=113653 RepID=A0A7C4WEH8_9EURY
MLYLRLEFDVKDPEVIAKALKPDDTEWAKSFNSNGKLIVEIKTKKIGTAMNAAEDFFRNIKAALSVLDALEP